MGHESPIELWSPNFATFCYAGFGTDRLRCQEAMKTTGRENPNYGVALPRNRAPGAVGHNRSRSIKWAAKQEKFQPKEMCFFLTSTFIERSGSGAWQGFLNDQQTYWNRLRKTHLQGCKSQAGLVKSTCLDL